MKQLTRRDRLTLSLALECVRVSAVDALDILRHGDAVSLALLYAGQPQMKWFGPLGTPECRAWLREYTIYRCRLALVLRAILRADAGFVGPVEWRPVAGALWQCERCLEYVPEEDYCRNWECLDAEANLQIENQRVCIPFSPLWESAPRTGEAKRPDGLRRRGAP